MWVKELDNIRTRATLATLRISCNQMLARRERLEGELPRECGKRWPQRFINANITLFLSKDKVKELDRQAAEDPEIVGAWYESYKAICDLYGI